MNFFTELLDWFFKAMAVMFAVGFGAMVVVPFLFVVFTFMMTMVGGMFYVVLGALL